MRTVIYSRVSTLTQTTDNQLAQLTALYPHAEIVQETASGAKARPELKRLVDSLRKGDVLVVATMRLDKLKNETENVKRTKEVIKGTKIRKAKHVSATKKKMVRSKKKMSLRTPKKPLKRRVR